MLIFLFGGGGNNEEFVLYVLDLCEKLLVFLGDVFNIGSVFVI